MFTITRVRNLNDVFYCKRNNINFYFIFYLKFCTFLYKRYLPFFIIRYLKTTVFHIFSQSTYERVPVNIFRPIVLRFCDFCKKYIFGLMSVISKTHFNTSMNFLDLFTDCHKNSMFIVLLHS